MSSKNKTLLLLNLLIVVAIVIIVLIIDTFLSNFIANEIVKNILLVILSAVLYLLFAFKNMPKYDDSLQTMVENTLHELNTPISTIKANIFMLEKSLHDKKDLSRVQRIKQASKDLINLYEKIEYKIKKEIDYVEIDSFDIKDIVDESISKFEDIKDNISINNYLSSYMITTDKIGFSSVIDNLISNAIKYNKKDGFVKIYQKDSRLIIEDSGCGIDTKRLFIVFDRYYQQDVKNRGFGVGLFIVKEFCDKYNIGIKIDSKDGVSTKISLDLKELSYKHKLSTNNYQKS